MAKLAILAKSPCMQWRNWRKNTSLWRFELDDKSGPLEAGNFGENGDFGEIGEIGDFGKNRQRAGDMWQNIQYNTIQYNVLYFERVDIHD